MNKKILIAVLVAIVIATVGVIALLGSGGDDFSKNMQEAGDASAEEVIIAMDLDKSLNDHSKKGIEKNINLTTKSIPLLEKTDVSFNKALNSTDNETIKKYLKLAIKLNQLDLNEVKAKQIIFKAEQDYNNEKISVSEYDEKFEEYRKNYENYSENAEKLLKR